MRHLMPFVLLAAAVAMAGCEKQQPAAPVPAPKAETEPPVRSLESLAATDSTSKDTTGIKSVGKTPETEIAGPTSLLPQRTYTVQPGDKGGFFAIARKVFGDEKRWKDIQAMNPGVDPTKLKVGQVIKVPEK
jgi:nucleoid-associated protein YgaU